ncbi:MAG: helix-hairpin-helix domain-containing protein [Candidatus Heimdallarchaeaceae archaeon]
MVESEILKIKSVGPKIAKTLEDCGYNTIEKISKATAEELSQLPGIGKATAEKIILNAKEAQKTTVKKAVTKAPPKKAVTKIEKEALDKIPSPKKIAKKTPVKEPSADILPSVKDKTPAKAAPKPGLKKPISKKPTPVKKGSTKVAKPIKSAVIRVPEATKRAIENAPPIPTIRTKKSSKKKKKAKIVKLNETFGIVQSIVHGRSAKSKNNSIVLSLHNIEIPLEKYIGRKVRISLSEKKEITGKITKIHGKNTSRENTVIVRFSKNISPHIITSKAEIL